MKECATKNDKCLRIPRPDKAFTVAVYAGDIGIGAVLPKRAGAVEYASRVLTAAEQKYLCDIPIVDALFKFISGENCLR